MTPDPARPLAAAPTRPPETPAAEAAASHFAAGELLTEVASAPTAVDFAIEATDFPQAPRTLAETGLPEDLVLELLIKTFYSQGDLTALQAAQQVALPFVVVDPLLEHLKREKELEVRAVDGNGRPFYRYTITGHGRDRAREALERCHYVGPAPVPLGTYADWVRRQTVNTTRISWDDLRRGFSQLVLSNRFLMMLGPAVNSGKSLFLYGPAGNGKTLVAETIAGLLGGAIWVPHAIEVGGQVIKVYDPVYHQEPDP
jgi:hypothetical protein